ncbi:MAG: hypothetical protein QMD71_09035 [bacterium]|nr:hypothetical protein [bacterium]
MFGLLMLAALTTNCHALDKYVVDFVVANGYEPAIAVNDSGYTFIVFTATDYTIQLEVYDKDGIYINGTSAEPERGKGPDVACWGEDSCVVVWGKDIVSGENSRCDIHYAIYTREAELCKSGRLDVTDGWSIYET